MEKQCFKCKKIKNIDDFYKHPQMDDGHLGKCKTCAKNDVAKNRKDKIDYYREFDRRRGSRQPRSYLRKWRKENPDKYAAHMILNNGIRNGSVERGDCERCGSGENIHGHHKDYSEPLNVNWLCAVCHKEEHPRQ